MMFRAIPFVTLLVAVAIQPVQAATTTIDTTKTYQTIEGLGGAITFYDGWLTAHPYKLEIYTNAFAGLNLSMLRLADWYRYNAGFNSTGEGAVAGDIVSNANRVLGHPVQVYMSSWAPPAFLKSNGQTGNGGTLITNSDGSFDYTGFAQYWYDSLQAYKTNGVVPTWISIQNEPDWAAGYDSCVLTPTEQMMNGTNYASYAKALDATYQKLTNMPSPPKLLGPECVHIGYGDLQNYATYMNPNSFYGVNYHLYGGSTDGSPDGYAGDFQTSTNIFPSKPHFMTEFGYPDMMNTACLIFDGLTIGNESGFNYWSLVWPYAGDALVEIENPYANRNTWTNAPAGVTTDSHGWWLTPAYWAMKHFSYFIQPGFRRVSASDNDPNVRSCAFLSPDNLRLVVVLINTNATTSSTMTFNFGIFNVGGSSIYQTAGTNTYAGTNTFLPLGPLTNSLVLPPLSITTVVLDQTVSVGPATNPSPANGASGVALNSGLNWTPGSNAVAHAVYLGVDSNAVAQATTSSPQFLGVVTNSFIYPPLVGGTTYYWRVDESIGVNTNASAVWSFSTVPVPALLHEYRFSEMGGATTADSVGGPAWTGTLPNGGTLLAGKLALSAGSQQYLSLPSGIVSTVSNFTAMVWVNLSSTTNWARIFDFGNNTTVSMYLTPQNGDTGTLRFAITTNSYGGEQQINCNSTVSTGVWHQVAVTLNATTGMLYLDGIPAGTNSAMTLNPLVLGSTANNYIAKSQWPDPYLNGQIDEFRIYGVALSPAEIAATYALGPNQLLSTNSPAAVASMFGTNLTMTWPLASAGFTLQSSTNLASGIWVNVTSPAPQIVSTNWQVTLPATNAIQFFRLSK